MPHVAGRRSLIVDETAARDHDHQFRSLRTMLARAADFPTRGGEILARDEQFSGGFGAGANGLQMTDRSAALQV